jgi:hypothetical protein
MPVLISSPEQRSVRGTDSYSSRSLTAGRVTHAGAGCGRGTWQKDRNWAWSWHSSPRTDLSLNPGNWEVMARKRDDTPPYSANFPPPTSFQRISLSLDLSAGFVTHQIFTVKSFSLWSKSQAGGPPLLAVRNCLLLIQYSYSYLPHLEAVRLLSTPSWYVIKEITVSMAIDFE